MLLTWFSGICHGTFPLRPASTGFTPSVCAVGPGKAEGVPADSLAVGLLEHTLDARRSGRPPRIERFQDLTLAAKWRCMSIETGECTVTPVTSQYDESTSARSHAVAE